jgi:hypothetical protein
MGVLVREKESGSDAFGSHSSSVGAHAIILPSFQSAKLNGAPIAVSPPNIAFAIGRLFRSLFGSFSPHLKSPAIKYKKNMQHEL